MPDREMRSRPARQGLTSGLQAGPSLFLIFDTRKLLWYEFLLKHDEFSEDLQVLLLIGITYERIPALDGEQISIFIV